jgi:cytochrome c553
MLVMNKGVLNLAVVFAVASAISVGCGSDDNSGVPATGGASGAAGKAGSGGKSGSAGASGAAGVTSSAGEGPLLGGEGGTAGSENGGQPGLGGAENAGEAGAAAAGEAGSAGAGPVHTQAMILRGQVLVRNVALCGGCHTATGGAELGGNPAFKNSTLPAPNLTPDVTGLGKWTDAQIINAFRNGIDDEGRHLDSAMPYWLFHNMSYDDALAIVAFLRSLPPFSGEVGATNPDKTPVTPLSPSAFPDTSLPSSDAEYAAAVQGKYLVSSVAQCVKCHSAATNGLPTTNFFAGVAPAMNTTIFSPNITPDATGISGWTAADVVTALKLGTNKLNVTLCGSMPSGTKGYGGMSDADAHAIGVYLTTIPALPNAAANPTLEPACPAQ